MQTLVEMADTLVADFDLVDLFQVVTNRCVELLDVAAAGLMLVAADGRLQVVASSSEAMRVVELFELEAEEGPCLDCYRTGSPVVNQDLTSDGVQWPRFAEEALSEGFHAVHALPLRLRGQAIGALNLFHHDTGRMSQDDVVVGQALADLATIAVLQHRASAEAEQLNANLSHALNSRVVIEQAKGIIAANLDLTMGESFELLRRHSRRNNRRMAGAAQEVVDGTLPISALTADTSAE